MAAECVEAGTPLNPDLEIALFHGSSIGGARPKALLTDAKRKLIAKFSSQSDFYNVIKAEFIAMRLAKLCGISAAKTEIIRVAGKDVLLIERFDRELGQQGWLRKSMISALTLFGLDEMSARYASYADFCEIIRAQFLNPKATLRELFSRLVFNILVGNTDDHARNHAAFLNGSNPELTPAYDICPQTRTGNETTQAMFITAEEKQSRLSVCLKAAPNFMLTEAMAAEIIENQLHTLRAEWDNVCDTAELPSVEQNYFAGRQFLNASIFYGLSEKYAAWASIARGF